MDVGITQALELAAVVGAALAAYVGGRKHERVKVASVPPQRRDATDEVIAWVRSMSGQRLATVADIRPLREEMDSLRGDVAVLDRKVDVLHGERFDNGGE